MLDVLNVPAFRAADALHYALEQAIAGLAAGDPVLLELRAACVEALAQSIYVALRPAGEGREHARDRGRRATRRVAILIEVARSRGHLDEAAAKEVLVRNAAVWHQIRQIERRAGASAPAAPKMAMPPVPLKHAARPTADRRQPASPLRSLQAGVIVIPAARSAAVAAARAPTFGPEEATVPDPLPPPPRGPRAVNPTLLLHKRK